MTKFKKCKKHLEGHLKDPDSLKIESAIGYKADDGKIVFKIEYNAKNSYGAYVGTKTAYFVIDGSEIECNNCDVLARYSSTMYTLISLQGKEIYKK